MKALQFDIVDRNPSVLCLDVHLNNQYTLYFGESWDVRAIA